LSGGNLQRLIVGRALTTAPRVLVAFNPTRGLDIAAARAVYDALESVLQAGTAVLLISTDLDEILDVSDRVAVLYRGRLSPTYGRPLPTQRIALHMAGEA
jgi:simple sugar transport system ATP-binding protein